MHHDIEFSGKPCHLVVNHQNGEFATFYASFGVRISP
jgi:hypothetical protein